MAHHSEGLHPVFGLNLGGRLVSVAVPPPESGEEHELWQEEVCVCKSDREPERRAGADQAATGQAVVPGRPHPPAKRLPGSLVRNRNCNLSPHDLRFRRRKGRAPR